MQKRYSELEGKLKSGRLKPVMKSLGGETIYLNGEITPQMASEFKKIVSAEGTKVKRLVINSPGGNVQAGNQIADWVFERFTNLKVSVPFNGICASMCTHILRCAQSSSTDKSALFMYHPAALNSESRRKLDQSLKNGSMARIAADMISGMATNALHNGKCAKSNQSEGDSKVMASEKAGQEICFSAQDIDKNYEGLVHQIEGTSGGMLDPDRGHR